MSGILSLIIFLPLFGGLIILFIPKSADRLMKQIALVVSIVSLLLSLVLAQ